MANKKIIAIDGPSGAGKSTVAKALADKLNYVFIDTGAMYRAIAWKAKKEEILLDNESLQALCFSTNISLKRVPAKGGMRILVDETDITDEIRTREIGMMASQVSAFPCVRGRLFELQRKMGCNKGIVMEGRDIGTVVFPDADVKFFLDAKIEERGKRRYHELLSKGIDSDLDTITDEIKKRDQADTMRAIAPLQISGDSIYIDTSGMTIQDVVKAMLKEIEKSCGT